MLASIDWNAGNESVPRLPPTSAIAPSTHGQRVGLPQHGEQLATPMFAPWKPSSSLRAL